MTKKTRQKLEALLNAIERNVEIKNTNDSLSKWVASVKAEIKNGGILESIVGWGDTPDKAVEDMLSHVSGKLLVTDAFSPTRREIYFKF